MAEAPVAIHQVAAPGGGLIVVLPGPAARAAGIFPDSTGLYLVTDQGGVNLEECSDPDAARDFANAIAEGSRMWGRRRVADKGFIRDPARRHEDVLAAIDRRISPDNLADVIHGLMHAKKMVTVAGAAMEVEDNAARKAGAEMYLANFVGTPTPRTPIEGETKQTLGLNELLDQPAVRDLLLMRLLEYPGALDSVMAKLSAMGIAGTSGNSSNV